MVGMGWCVWWGWGVSVVGVGDACGGCVVGVCDRCGVACVVDVG